MYLPLFGDLGKHWLLTLCGERLSLSSEHVQGARAGACLGRPHHVAGKKLAPHVQN